VDYVLSFVKGDLEQWQMFGELEHDQGQERENLEENLEMGDDLE
jgi:hypothetical protein